METLKNNRIPDKEEFEKSLAPARRFVEVLECECDNITAFLTGKISSEAYELTKTKLEAEKRLIFIKTTELPSKKGYIETAIKQWQVNMDSLQKEHKMGGGILGMKS